MYYADLTAYSYLDGYERAGLLNVGWLDQEHPFPTAEPSINFIAALWSFCRRRVAGTRGYHLCELCSNIPHGPITSIYGSETLRLGTAEIRVFDNEGGAFAAPDLIFHYVVDHHYDPPPVFVSAVLTGPRPGSAEYEALVLSYDHPTLPPRGGSPRRKSGKSK